MKIYVIHSTGFEYEKELYEPLRKSGLAEFVFPHEKSKKPFNSKKILPTCDAVVAEVSYPSTGSGIELGWADSFKVPIIAACKKNSNPSSAIPSLARQWIEYSSSEELVQKLAKALKKL